MSMNCDIKQRASKRNRPGSPLPLPESSTAAANKDATGINNTQMKDVTRAVPDMSSQSTDSQLSWNSQSPKRARRTVGEDSPLSTDSPATVAKKAKRRSSFVRGRISALLPLPTDSEAQFDDIPVNVAEDERLAALISTAANYSVQQLRQEFPHLDGMQQFCVQARQVVDEKVEELKRNGLLTKATTTERCLPNPANEAIEQSIQDGTDYTDRLHQESAAWDELVNEHQQSAMKVAEMAKAVKDNAITERPTTLPAKLASRLDARPDYAKMADVRPMTQAIVMASGEVEDYVTILGQIHTSAEQRLAEQAQLLKSSSFAAIKDFGDARKLIKNIMDTDNPNQ